MCRHGKCLHGRPGAGGNWLGSDEMVGTGHQSIPPQWNKSIPQGAVDHETPRTNLDDTRKGTSVKHVVHAFGLHYKTL